MGGNEANYSVKNVDLKVTFGHLGAALFVLNWGNLIQWGDTGVGSGPRITGAISRASNKEAGGGGWLY